MHARAVLGLAASFAAIGAACSLARPLLSTAWWLWLYLPVEALFAGFYCVRARQLARQPDHEHAPEQHNASEAIASFLRQIRFFKVTKEYVEPWFNDTPLSNVFQGNILDLLSYGFFYKSV